MNNLPIGTQHDPMAPWNEGDFEHETELHTFKITVQPSPEEKSEILLDFLCAYIEHDNTMMCAPIMFYSEEYEEDIKVFLEQEFEGKKIVLI